MTQIYCKAITKSGNRCKNLAIIFGLCIPHYNPKGSSDANKKSKLRNIIEYYQNQLDKYQKEYDELKNDNRNI